MRQRVLRRHLHLKAQRTQCEMSLSSEKRRSLAACDNLSVPITGRAGLPLTQNQLV